MNERTKRDLKQVPASFRWALYTHPASARLRCVAAEVHGVLRRGPAGTCCKPAGTRWNLLGNLLEPAAGTCGGLLAPAGSLLEPAAGSLREPAGA